MLRRYITYPPSAFSTVACAFHTAGLSRRIRLERYHSYCRSGATLASARIADSILNFTDVLSQSVTSRTPSGGSASIPRTGAPAKPFAPAGPVPRRSCRTVSPSSRFLGRPVAPSRPSRPAPVKTVCTAGPVAARRSFSHLVLRLAFDTGITVAPLFARRARRAGEPFAPAGPLPGRPVARRSVKAVARQDSYPFSPFGPALIIPFAPAVR